MTILKTALASSVVLTALHGASPTSAQTRVDWIGAPGAELAWDEGDFGGGEGANWASGNPPLNFQPDGTFGSGEYASISNGGVALVDHAIAISPSEVRLGEDSGSSGALVLRDGGSLTVQPGVSGSGVLANGVGGTGRLVLRDNLGAFSLQGYTQNAASTLVAQLGGPSSFVNPVSVANEIDLAGTLRLEATPGSGFVASAGNSWTIMQGSSVTGGFDAVEQSPGLLSNAGQYFSVSTESNGVVVSVDQRLVLTIDRFTGQTSLSNPAGHATSLGVINYTLRANSGLQSDDANWQSFADDNSKPGWYEANPTSTALSELNPTGTQQFAPGSSHDFGTPLTVDTSAPLGAPRVSADGVSLSYQLPTGEYVEAGLEVVGRFNDLVLVVDPQTGAATIQNQSNQALDLIGYTISSTTDSLLPDYSGSGLTDWRTANPTTSDLSELSIGDALSMGSGAEAPLGVAWDVASGPSDPLTFFYQTEDGGFHQGTVHFGDLAEVPPLLAGDYNNDGAVNAADYTVWRDAEGTSATLPNDAIGGVIGPAQYVQWSSNYGATNAPDATAIPEPLSLALVLVTLALQPGRRCER
ncbi:hypothetical protein [Botrimarina mediterranea]|uniref:LTD domain-containing protein n=1 Tax=Botrimarina mediterranea TaxID=2528022 RepID=A0A518K2F2_9BACT|nr:hypothetical protein [Botrimarina mediterranea]QDV71935.1 hypothetical protein Spa11_01040 [Botrimarina mediterranea]QDV76476.1 hypothetical protein K2D_00540 [Planctomycetes bacterium K2D]